MKICAQSSSKMAPHYINTDCGYSGVDVNVGEIGQNIRPHTRPFSQSHLVFPLQSSALMKTSTHTGEHRSGQANIQSSTVYRSKTINSLSGSSTIFLKWRWELLAES